MTHNKSELWGAWTREIPPVEGAFATEQGWVQPLKGTDPADNLTEVIVTIGGLNITAGNANIQTVAVVNAAGFFLEAETMDFEVTYNEAVDVLGTPQIELTIDSGTVFADFLSGTGTNKLIFRYTVGANDIAATGPTAVSPIGLNGGTIFDIGTAVASGLTYTPLPDLSGHIVDAVEPTITGVVSPEQGNDVATGGTVNINVTYDEAVIVTGTPQIPVFNNDGTTPLLGNSGLADFAGGSGTTVLNYQYTVVAGDSEITGIKLGADVSLNGGTLKDASGNDADLTFAQVTTTVTLND